MKRNGGMPKRTYRFGNVLGSTDSTQLQVTRVVAHGLTQVRRKRESRTMKAGRKRDAMSDDKQL